MDKIALGQFFPPKYFDLPVNIIQSMSHAHMIGPVSFIYHQRYLILVIDSAVK